jgi:hypothetical protein
MHTTGHLLWASFNSWLMTCSLRLAGFHTPASLFTIFFFFFCSTAQHGTAIAHTHTVWSTTTSTVVLGDDSDGDNDTLVQQLPALAHWQQLYFPQAKSGDPNIACLFFLTTVEASYCITNPLA